MSLAGVQPGLWKVKGGNKQVPERLIQESNANVVHSKIDAITKIKERDGSSRYQLHSGDSVQDYDIVIVATPLNRDMSDIKFNDFTKQIGQFDGKFHRTVATFIKGVPNFEYFGYSNLNDFPTEVLTVNDNVFFNSIGRQTPVDFKEGEESSFQGEPVWKVFSQKPLTDAQVNDLFSKVTQKEVVDWMAYPHYESNEKDIPPFKLDSRLYYVNAIESAASAMEMSIIGGVNVANLAYNDWHGHDRYVDPYIDEPEEGKTEL